MKWFAGCVITLAGGAIGYASTNLIELRFCSIEGPFGAGNYVIYFFSLPGALVAWPFLWAGLPNTPAAIAGGVVFWGGVALGIVLRRRPRRHPPL